MQRTEAGTMDNSHLLVVLHIDNRLLPLAGWDLTVEQDINLTVRETLHLRKIEECRDQANEAGETPDVTALATKVSAL
jgi:hypothetical protein